MCVACAIKAEMNAGRDLCVRCLVPLARVQGGDVDPHECYPAVSIRWDDGTFQPVQDCDGEVAR
jgi:hypothetical protein